MNQDLALWAMGILCSMIGALMLVILSRVLRQGDDTNAKVTTQSATLARVENSVTNLDGRVTDLHKWKSELQARELQRATDEIAELKRKALDSGA